MKKGWLATIAGVLAALGSLPTLATNSHLALPLWWNDLTGLLNLAGIMGVVLLGWVAKGADDHSTVAQVEIATVDEKIKKENQ